MLAQPLEAPPALSGIWLSHLDQLVPLAGPSWGESMEAGSHHDTGCAATASLLR